jgi:hypothetical protein
MYDCGARSASAVPVRTEYSGTKNAHDYTAQTEQFQIYTQAQQAARLSLAINNAPGSAGFHCDKSADGRRV